MLKWYTFNGCGLIIVGGVVLYITVPTVIAFFYCLLSTCK